MEAAIQTKKERRKIHPHKFAMWIAIGSIMMMFAGLTSAYIVRQAQGNWVEYKLPLVFWASTVIILASSVTMHLSLRAFKDRAISRYRMLLLVTFILGIAFGLSQYMGFTTLYAQQHRLDGNPSESFLFVIAGLHLLHIAGGVVALIIRYLLSFRKNIKVYNTSGLEVIATYWHFVDVLWIYLFVFFLANQ